MEKNIKIDTNRRLAQRLPRELAYRYHALPVAEEGDRITVVMADPDDPEAACAVAAALGTLPYLVQSDPEAIDAMLDQVWLVEDRLHLLVCDQPDSRIDAEWLYTQALSELLDARVSVFVPIGDIGDIEALEKEVAQMGHDLIIFGEPCQSLVEQLLLGPVDHQPTSLLLARGLCWPIQRMLLVVGHDKGNDTALEWAVRLALPSGAAVTILLVLPPVPAVDDQQGQTPQDQIALSNTNARLEREMRRIGRRLEDKRVERSLRLRRGAPIRQLQLEVVTGDYDLIIVSADSTRWWLHWLMEEQANAMLRWAGRPVLIAKPNTP